jgi:hypothetical protein
MKLGKGNNFKWKSAYYRNLIGLSVFVIAFTWLFVNTIMLTEEQIFDLFMNRGLIGRARQRMAIGIEKFIVRNWGKNGLVITNMVITAGAYYIFLKEFFEFRRFLKKEKLFKQGLVDNMYDDHKPQSIFQLIKWVFSKKERNTRQKYKDIDKLQKDLEKDGLYQKLYGKKDKK